LVLCWLIEERGGIEGGRPESDEQIVVRGPALGMAAVKATDSKTN
jgi:hypothetical protein